MSTTKRRTAQQIAADALLAQKATADAKRQAALRAGARADATAQRYHDLARQAGERAEAYETAADALASEMARIDRAVAALKGA